MTAPSKIPSLPRTFSPLRPGLRTRRIARNDGLPVEVVEEAPSVEGRLTWLATRMTVRPALAVGSYLPRMPWPFGLVDFAAKAVLPAPGTVRANIRLPHCTAQLVRAAELDRSEVFPVSAATGEGVPELVEHLASRLPEGPLWYPPDMVSDVEEAFWVAELVREKLLAVTRSELPHSIACRCVEWEWPYIRVEILVERESQKPIVIGKRGSVLKQVGTEVREQLPEGAYLELHVKVDKDWQRRARSLERLGY